MLKKTITYTDIEGELVTDSFFFNLTQAEIAKMSLSKKGGFSRFIQTLQDTNDSPEMTEVIDDFLRRSFGVKTSDGKFIKRDSDYEAFKTTEAYSMLFMELLLDNEKAYEFVKGVVPKNLSAQMPKVMPSSIADLQKVEQAKEEVVNEAVNNPANVTPMPTT